MNAIYLHKEAILSICNKFHAQNYSDIKKNIEALKILEVRHKIGAHSVNFQDKNTLECYTPNQGSIGNKTLEFYNMCPSSSEYETIDLELLINEYLKYVFSEIENLVKNVVQCIFKTNQEAYDEILSKIDLISRHIKGKVMVINNCDAKKVITIEFV